MIQNSSYFRIFILSTVFLVCLQLCLQIYPSVSLFVCLSVFLPVCLSMYYCLALWCYKHTSGQTTQTHLSVYLFVSLSPCSYLSKYLLASLSLCLPICSHSCQSFFLPLAAYCEERM
jgi:hypothetical protein